ncbi:MULTISPECIES: DNA polymerase III subunit gamma/tau [unclassified Campylobacter]|uniref:DNA polymerase III subunit gamma/tau n=1 Tax=unclassified Campylobacter TaxID=2593542 RepID=UPI0022E9F71C|nr:MULTISPECIES: DNA polymerase III subunit gamma/tau [unclassified Campylobacter]MDA3043759.1 DNA polymerase III subunit gamma/tau [Campylobacter sp. JMF_09 ED2]MDA3045289.1 DNA polymerase III subunit gamma/tau [Campylobacter sp. JMF_07 ED4]MDA3064476.1 DNA polymerase III subunit gamma/tau [Campylobacter sp. JMF_11 EL3]MDA3072168.1 DNA polymerase III subunit gamma/tau [Campylobacter sp. VBCF_03 NA9]MDA3075626.1 DNA polymerase III subunit gamma/tau [Campylobacter sp. JMF_05 ED3]
MLQALALKYRPKNFDALIGQNAIASSLAHALDGARLGHAYLFSGLRGSGKTSTARIFAKALLCDHGPTSKPCESCDNCIMANEGRHIDIIEMDAASHRKIDDIRELIEQTKYSPASARFKIFIIDEVHMLTKEASNALLKTLEEPPAYVKFILATTDPLKLPATVLSRTQHFRFKPIAQLAIISHLEAILQNEGISYENGALKILARSGSGSLRDTLTLLDQAIIYSEENVTQTAVADMLGLLDPAKINEILEIVLRQDRVGAIEIVKEIENYNAETIIDEMIANLKEKFLRNDTKFSMLIYERFFRILAGAKSMLGVSSDNTYSLLMMIFLMMEAVNLQEIDELIEISKSIGDSGASGANLGSAPNFATPKSAQANANFSAPRNAPNLTQNSAQNSAPVQNKTSQKLNDLEQKVAQKTGADTLSANSAYDKFLSNLYDRSYELGEKFDNCIEFVKFENSTLYLISRAKNEDKEYLRAASRAINSVLKMTFGENAKISITQNAPLREAEPKPNLTTPPKDLPKPNLLNQTNLSNYEISAEAAKPDMQKTKNELAKLASEAVSKEEILKTELANLFGEPSKIVEN